MALNHGNEAGLQRRYDQESVDSDQRTIFDVGHQKVIVCFLATLWRTKD